MLTTRSAMTKALPVALLASAATSVLAQSSESSSGLQTAIPSPTGQADSVLPSQAALPPKQAWCPSEIFCAGEILQAINVAWPYADSKTIVDKPTKGTSNETVQAYEEFKASNGFTFGEVSQFLESHFQGEGLELRPNPLENFPENPAAFTGIPDAHVKGFALAVHNIWNLLIRDTDETTLCTEGKCESTLIPLNHTFVVPGGRFREQYYWDSKFILHGLLESELYSVANATLQNFMDEIERFGFIPNGGRIYYLNRSQPPVFISMVAAYVNRTKDTGILTRALPIMEAELTWWQKNRTIDVKSPFTNETYPLAHYAVVNSAPRPESYREDYLAANGDDLERPYTDEEKADLYAELASGAESGWDYSSRWEINPFAPGANLTHTTPGLRTLNVRKTVAVDLNAILYRARTELADLYELSAGSLAKRVKRQSPSDRATVHREAAATIKAGILDLFWDAERLAFYDFNLTSNARNDQLTAAHWYPLWANVIPAELVASEQNAFGAFASLNFALRRYNGTYPATFVETGLQWDFPNSWPPHIFFALEALANLPANVTSGALPQADNSFSLVPKNQFGVDESALPAQVLADESAAPAGVDLNALNGTVTNGGNASEGEGWAAALQRQLANRYYTSVYCGWYATGGSIPDILPQLSEEILNITHSVGQTGHLFEKFSAVDIDAAGKGGEYVVQAGFGWTNGVALWAAAKYKDVLVRPNCPTIEAISDENGGGGSGAIRGAMSSPLAVALAVAVAGLATIAL